MRGAIPAAPRHVGMSTFYRLVTSPGTLRFSFVRNPYARLVSAWADKYRDKPLVPGDSFIDQYLKYRRDDGQAPHCAMPQPYLVPVSPISSRMIQSKGVSGSMSSR
jgi:hypothetical protein